jgi:general secretion pathway protein G
VISKLAKIRHNRQGGFTLIELLIVVAIIGIIAAIAVPSLLNAVQRARQKRSMADMRSVGTALESYNVDNFQYPDTLIPLGPTYIAAVPNVDGWNTNFLYEVSSAAGSTTNDLYTVTSFGRNKQDDGCGTGVVTRTQNFDCDICFTIGQFVQYPEGVQN